MFVARDAKGNLVNALAPAQPVGADYDYAKDRVFERILPMKG